MPNQYKNKVIFGNTVLIDISDTTAEASDVADGKYFYSASGEKIEGTAQLGGNYQAKTVTPSASTQVIVPDSSLVVSVPAGTQADVAGDQYRTFTIPSLSSGTRYVVEGELSTDDGTIISLNDDFTYSSYRNVTYTVISQGTSEVSGLLLMGSTIYIEFYDTSPTLTVSEDITINSVPISNYDALSEVTVLGDSNLIPDNIRNGIDIFGVIGALNAGAGLSYETGIYEPSSDIARPTINFSETHSQTPMFVMFSDTTDTSDTTTNTNWAWMFCDPWRVWGSKLFYSSSAYRYAWASYIYRGTSTTSLVTSSQTMIYNADSTSSNSNTYTRYWVTESNFKPSTVSSSRYWRAGRTYKWIAVWKP